jgi:hypothetical protein
LGIHAVLRRELWWGNLFLVVLGFLGGSPRESTEGGGQFCVHSVRLKECFVNWVGFVRD